MDFMGYTYEDDTSRKKSKKSAKREAPIWMRLIIGIFSIFFPGLGQIIQKKQMLAFDIVILLGASLLIGRMILIRTHLGIWTPILMAVFLLLPSILSFVMVVKCKTLPGDADTVIRNIFLYVFFYLIAIGPFHLINATFGFKTYRFEIENIHMNPLILQGDAAVINRGAYGSKTFGHSKSDTIKIGDIVYHTPVPEQVGGDNSSVHLILAIHGDTIKANDGEVTVNSKKAITPEEYKYTGPENFGPVVVPKTQVFLVDNRGVFFPFYTDNIHGRVISILWSRTNRGSFRWNRFGRSIESLNKSFVIIDTTSVNNPDSAIIVDSLISIEDTISVSNISLE
ncbi:hypothetical protein KAH81_01600 [bacterium]|nr:hypothetical protein [bacterium]